MPTILRLDGVRVFIYPDDHRPQHVHLFAAGKEAVFELECPDGPLQLRDNKGFSLVETRRLSTALTPHVKMLCAAWEAIHDHQ